MRISKLLLVVCAAVVCINPQAVRGDSKAQKQAIEALRQKMNELETQPPAAAPKPEAAPAAKPVEPVKPAPAPVVAPAPKPAPVVAPAVVTPPPAEDEAIVKAREALRQKMNQLDATTPAPVTPPAAPAPTPMAAPTPAPVAKPVVAAPLPVAPAVTAPQPAEDEAIAKAREALRNKMNELEAQAPAPVTPAPAVAPSPVVTPAAPVVAQPAVAAPAPVKPAPAMGAPTPAEEEAIAKAREALRQKMNELQVEEPAKPVAVPQPAVVGQPSNVGTVARAESPKPAAVTGSPTPKPSPTPAPKSGIHGRAVPTFPPLEAPALPISMSKQQRLDELLRQYRTDQISPEQYHSARAKVLAEP